MYITISMDFVVTDPHHTIVRELSSKFEKRSYFKTLRKCVKDIFNDTSFKHKFNLRMKKSYSFHIIFI